MKAALGVRFTFALAAFLGAAAFFGAAFFAAAFLAGFFVAIINKWFFFG